MKAIGVVMVNIKIEQLVISSLGINKNLAVVLVCGMVIYAFVDMSKNRSSGSGR